MQGGRKKSTATGSGRKASVVAGVARGGGVVGALRYRQAQGAKNDPLGEQMETRGMSKAEDEQRAHQDAFWGVDKESNDRELDRRLMSLEFELSLANELQHSTRQQQAEWEREYQAKQHEEAYRAAVREMQTRRMYMQSLFAAGSSHEIMQYVWNPETHVQPHAAASITARGADSPNRNPMLQQHQQHQGGGSPSLSRLGEDFMSDSMSGIESFAKILGGSTFELPSTDQQYRNHLHLDGIQQSKALASGQIQQGLGSSLRNRTASAGVAESAMSSSRKAGKQAATASKGASQGGGIGVPMGGGVFVTPLTGADSGGDDRSNNGGSPTKSASAAFKLTTSKGKSTILPPPPARKHIEALDGHPKLGWDQEALLSAAFDLLDTSRTGRLTMEKMSRIAKNHEVQTLLRFTVFGSLVKKKRWDEFRAIFPYEEAYIGMGEWMSAANAFTVEPRVALQAIRREDEHVRIVNSLQQRTGAVGWQWLVSSSSSANDMGSTADATSSSRGNVGWFAELARNHLFRRERTASLRTYLQTGDVVWALHGGGVVWLQAVVEGINADGTFSLTYPLSPVTIGRLREASLTRKLVQGSAGASGGGGGGGGNQQTDSPLVHEIDAIASKGLTELQVCARIFDLLFGDKAPQFVSVRMLVSGLYNPTNGIRTLVEGNSILSAVAPPVILETMDLISAAVVQVISSTANGDNGDASLRHDLFPPLATVLCDSFKPNDFRLTRADWIAFCGLVGDRASLRQQ